jgi:sialate O-acetylesterase
VISARNLLLFAIGALLVAPLLPAHAQSAPKSSPPNPPSLDSAIFGGNSAAPRALPFVSSIFGDNMVLQRGKLDTIWGWSSPGDTVTVRIAGHRASAVAGTDRRWQVRFKPPKTGGPYNMKISDGRQSAEFHNVMVGDVWLCGGQSNMEVPLRFSDNGAQVAKEANFPGIRYFTVGEHSAYRPTYTMQGSWKEVSPQTADWVSAVAFYFGRQLHQKLHVPIGLVVDAVGGSAAETWASSAALRPLGDYDVPLARVAQLAARGEPAYGNYIMPWFDEYDIGLRQHWTSTHFDDSSWKTVPVPGGFAALGLPSTPAVAWFRREITLPDPLPNGRSMIFLGEVQRMDSVWINGQYVGGSAWVENPRVYFLRPGVLRPGRNLIAIRVFRTRPHGGFLDKPAALHLTLGDHTAVPLAGEWKGKISVNAAPPHPMPLHFANWPVMPTVLYNGMLEPIAPLSLSGAIWYQAEQNSPRGYEYRKLLPAMIGDWRALFGQGNLPFYIVQLPAFGPRSSTPTDDGWADIRESQAITAKTVSHSCLAVIIDTGDPNSLHPGDKKSVGDRLAFCALAKHYGKHIAYSGPTLASVQRLSGRIRLRFSHANGGLVLKSEKPGGFSIAGSDRKWYWASARVRGDSVILSSASVPHPIQVRYDWQSDPQATLFNGAGLPASPFRTDTWPLVTQNVRPY